MKHQSVKNNFEVWIYDEESGRDEPMRCYARNAAEAKKLGRDYIRAWRLKGAKITKVERIKEEK